MRVFVFFVVLQIYDCKHHHKLNPRGVNLALETVLQFDKNDISADRKIIDKIGDILERLKELIDTTKKSRRSNGDKDSVLTFTEFIKKTIIILNDYSDKDLGDFIRIVDDQIITHHSKGGQFFELFADDEMKKFIAGKLYEMKSMPIEKVRSKLNEVLKQLTDWKHGVKDNRLAPDIDSLYSPKDAVKFKDFLKELSHYKYKSKRKNVDLNKIIDSGLRTIVLDHYTNLDVDARRNLKIKLEAFWNKINIPGKYFHHVWEFNTDNKKPNKNTEKAAIHDVVSIESIDEAHIKHVMKRQPEKNKKVKTTNVANEDKKIASNSKGNQTRPQRLRYITLYPEPIKYWKRTKRNKATTKQISPSLLTTEHIPTTKVKKVEKHTIKQGSTETESNESEDIAVTKSAKVRYTIVRRPSETTSTAESDEDRDEKNTYVRSGNTLEAIKSKSLSRKRKPVRQSIPTTTYKATSDNSNVNVTEVKITVTTSHSEETDFDNEEKDIKSQAYSNNQTAMSTKLDTLDLSQELDSYEVTTATKPANLSTTLSTTTAQYSNNTEIIDFSSSENELDVNLTDKVTLKSMLDNDKTNKDNVFSTRKSDETNEALTNITDSNEKMTHNLAINDKADLMGNKDSNETDIEKYINKLNPEPDHKNEKIRRIMLEDIKKMMPKSSKRTSASPRPPTIGVNDATDPLDIIDDGDDLWMK